MYIGGVINLNFNTMIMQKHTFPKQLCKLSDTAFCFIFKHGNLSTVQLIRVIHDVVQRRQKFVPVFAFMAAYNFFVANNFIFTKFSL